MTKTPLLFQVAWVQVDTQTVLTIHDHVITRNPRISLLHSDARTWHLYLTNVREKDRGWYMCQLNTDPMLYHQGYLDVVVPPDIIDLESSGDLTVREGEDVTLICRARGHPTPHVVWRREDAQDIILDEGNSVKEMAGETLVLHTVSRLQMGSYLCLAHNGVPPSVSKRTHLTVQFPPMVWVPQQLEGAHLGHQLDIECHAEAYPRGINYWTSPAGDMIVPGQRIETTVRSEGSYKVKMTLRIKEVTFQDLGTFLCVAKNSLGETDGSVRIYGLGDYDNTTRPDNTYKSPEDGNDRGEIGLDQGAGEDSLTSSVVQFGTATRDSGTLMVRSSSTMVMMVLMVPGMTRLL
nr:lachesin-like [Cherax quadricarinatus]